MPTIESITLDDLLTCGELERVYSRLPILEQLVDMEEKVFMVRLVLGTGIRVGELTALRLVDCAVDRITIRRSGMKADTTKANGVRTVKIMPELLPHYQRHVERLQNSVQPPEYLMRGVSDRTLMRWWKEILVECGVRDLSIHKGRHTYATHELQSGRLNLIQVRSQLGHSADSRTAERYYVHAIPDYIYAEGSPRWREIALGCPGA